MVLTLDPNNVSVPNNVIKKYENPNKAVPVYARTHTHTDTHTHTTRIYNFCALEKKTSKPELSVIQILPVSNTFW